MKISYAITVYNEHTEVDNLLHHLSKHIRDEDEVVVVQDISIKKSKSIGQDDVYALEKVIEKYEYGSYFNNLKVSQFEFKKDFAALKNFAKDRCSGDYIFHLDADEIPNETLLKQLPQILDINEVDLIWIPRINTVEGITDWHLKIGRASCRERV